jgi:hypothetical protein
MALPPNVGQTDMDQSRKMREQMEATFWFKAPSGQGKTWGTSYVRILPAHINMGGCFYWAVPIHFRIGPGKQILPCPRNAFNRPCPICQRGFDVRGKVSDEEFRSYMPSWQAYMNVVLLNEDGSPAEDPARVRLWSLSRPWLDQILEEADQIENFTDLAEGRDVRVKRRGEGYKTEYRIKLDPEPSKFDHPVVSELRDLQTISPYVDQETLLQALDAPAGGGGDPWASEQLPQAGAREPDQVTQRSGSRFGSDDDEARDATEASMPEKGGGAAPADAPPVSDEERDKAREHLQRASQPRADK